MKTRAVVVAGVLLACCASPSFASGLVDQQYVPTLPTLQYGNVGAGNSVDWSQTFAVGHNGYLTGFDVWVCRYPELTQPLLYDIRRTNAGTPTEGDTGSDILVSGMVAALDVPLLPPTNTIPEDFVRVRFASSVSVTAGDVLAIALRSNDPGTPSRWTYSWVGNDNGTYPGGTAFVRTKPSGGGIPTNIWSVTSIDYGFTTYYLVPEPSFASMLLTISALGLKRRERQ